MIGVLVGRRPIQGWGHAGWLVAVWACALVLNRPFLRTDARKVVWKGIQRLWHKVPSGTPHYSQRDKVILWTYGLLSGAATSIFLGPFTATVLAVLYFDLRVRKEGFDLELLARRLGTES